jgi:histidyl-tRNA synthetase
MKPKILAPKGVAEYFPPESMEFERIRDGLAQSARLAGYRYIELPVFEDTSLFVRGVGESTDVVSKEMYTFEDRGGRSLTLRPEGTAGVMRAVIEHGLDKGQLPVKLWYSGACFRAERPQQGRYRQFYQVGIEAIGNEDPMLDAEVISVAHIGFRNLGLRAFTTQITSLGDKNCRPAYREKLSKFLSELPLDPQTMERARINPLRVLDDKRPEFSELLKNAPLMLDHLCKDCKEHFESVKSALQTIGIDYEINPRMVRGLDYYTRTTFEFVHPLLGAQSGIGGGGRYDGLMQELGGSSLSGIGFGLGVDRTLLAARAENLHIEVEPLDLYLIPLSTAAREMAFEIAINLRRQGFIVDMSFGERGLKGAMKAADKSGARFSAVLGEDEMASQNISLKDMKTGSSREVRIGDLFKSLQNEEK